MITRIIKIGNSRGIRIPKSLLEQTGLADEVEMGVKRNQQNWISKFEHKNYHWHYRLAGRIITSICLFPGFIETAWGEFVNLSKYEYSWEFIPGFERWVLQCPAFSFCEYCLDWNWDLYTHSISQRSWKLKSTNGWIKGYNYLVYHDIEEVITQRIIAH